jgi:hypothetical protein
MFPIGLFTACIACIIVFAITVLLLSINVIGIDNIGMMETKRSQDQETLDDNDALSSS